MSRYRAPVSVLVVVLAIVMGTIGRRDPGIVSAQSGTPQPPPARRLPPNQPRQGLIFDGLQPPSRIPGDVCERLYRLPLTNLCTHGPDPAPEGVDITQSVDPVEPTSAQAVSGISCEGDGASGFRTEVIYARASDRPDRYSTYLTSFRQWALDADAIYHESAAATGGYRRIRFVHDASCTLIVRRATLSPAGDDTLDQTVSDLQALGYNRSDRKYMIFVDATVYCGIGHIYGDDQPGAANSNNTGPLYGRTDAGCWDGGTVAHEHMHNLGGVQLTAPNTSGGFHCVDDYDRMCYADAAGVTMRFPCADSADDRLFDCKHDDYYHTNPAAGSYLDTHWNAANNRFLISTQPTPTSTAVPATATPTPLAGSTTFTYSPAADTYVSQASPGSTYASTTQFQAVGAGTSASEKQAFIRFDVTNLPDGASINVAKLRLVVTNDSTSGGIFHRITNTAWPENITWTSSDPKTAKPAIDGAQLASLGAVTLNQVIEVTLPAGTITGNGSYSFAIILPSANTNTLGYASREASTIANRPQLLIGLASSTTQTSTPTRTPTNTPTATNTATATTPPTVTPTITPTAANTPTATSTNTPTATNTSTATTASTATATNTATETTALTATATNSPTATNMPTATPTDAATATHTATATSAPSATATNTPTATSAPSATSTPTVSNLLSNFGFELDANGDGRPDSWTSDSRFTRSSMMPHSSSYAGRFYSTSNSGITISQTVANLTAGRTYSFDGWVHIPSTTDAFTFRLEVRWINSSGSAIRSDTVKTYSNTSSKNVWDQATRTIVAPAGTTRAEARMVVSSLKATIYVDDFRFQAQ